MLQPPTDELSNVAKEQEPLDNPWFKKMYQAAVNFHERDDVLDSNDRYNLFKIYRSIAEQNYGEVGWAFLQFLLPHLHFNFTGQIQSKVLKSAVILC